jgi:1-acyl-sn-glycerol-3-phosphate acyltransferase
MDVEGQELVPLDKPVIFASTHSNSFYDAILIYLMFKKNVYALGRGDAFKNPMVAKILRAIHMLPIWRITEGQHNMSKNMDTFEECNGLFKRNQNVLIYPEGLCTNQTKLLPLKKRGTSAMAYRAWKEGIDVHVVPVVLTYDSFKTFGKRINLKISKPLHKENFDLSDEIAFSKAFTAELEGEMSQMFNHNFKPVGLLRNITFFLGCVLLAPLYLIIHLFVKKKYSETIFFDSIWYGFLYFTIVPYFITLFFILRELF